MKIKNKKAKIAIFGSTSHIAKGLINNFLENGEFSLHLYSRSADKVYSFVDAIGKSPDQNCVIHEGYEDFLKSSYDVIINCVGTGTLNKLQGDYTKYFTVTEKYDNLAIEYLHNNHPDTLYISFSSGAVYGRNYSKPMNEDTINSIQVNHVASEDYYALVRLYAETKHRAFKDLKIVDLRLFSYFSHFIDLTDNYFITELLDSLLQKKMFVTGSVNIVRDYVHPQDLFSIIHLCMKAGKINTAFDIVSTKPVQKREILAYFSSEYNLKYKVNESLSPISATGSKNIYYSKYNKATSIGYKPVFTSLETIQKEAKYLLKKKINHPINASDGRLRRTG